MTELACEALATKAELQELRDQINQLLGQPDEEEAEQINVLAAGTLAGTAILGGQLVDIDVVKQGSKVVELRKVARSGKVVKLKGLTQVVSNNAAKSTAVTKAAAVTGASLAGIFSVLSTLLSIFITTKQNELNGLILNNMEREAAARDLDYERLIKIAGKQQENIEVANTRITEMNPEIANAKITNEELSNDLERASPIFLTQNAIAEARRLTTSMFYPGVHSCCETTVCTLSSSQHHNQLNFEERAIYLA